MEFKIRNIMEKRAHLDDKHIRAFFFFSDHSRIIQYPLDMPPVVASSLLLKFSTQMLFCSLDNLLFIHNLDVF